MRVVALVAMVAACAELPKVVPPPGADMTRTSIGPTSQALCRSGEPALCLEVAHAVDGFARSCPTLNRAWRSRVARALGPEAGPYVARLLDDPRDSLRVMTVQLGYRLGAGASVERWCALPSPPERQRARETTCAYAAELQQKRAQFFGLWRGRLRWKDRGQEEAIELAIEPAGGLVNARLCRAGDCSTFTAGQIDVDETSYANVEFAPAPRFGERMRLELDVEDDQLFADAEGGAAIRLTRAP